MKYLFLISLSLWANDHCHNNGKIIREITFQGLEVSQAEIVQRELIHHPNQPFHCHTWEQEQKTLMGLSIFSSVTLQGYSQDSNSLQLAYEFQELPALLFLPNLGITDQEGTLLGLSLTGLNLWGQDLASSLSWRTNVHPQFNTSTEYFATFSSRWLHKLPMEWLLFGGRTNSYNNLKEFKERSWRTEVHLNYRIHGPWSLRLYGGHLQMAHTNPQEHPYLEPGSEDAWWTLGGGLRFDNRDSELQTMQGTFLEAELLPHQYFHSPLSFAMVRVDFRSWVSFGNHTLHPSFLLRIREGDVGFYDLYNAGGANTLRGYLPTKEQAGQSEWLRTLEYRYLFFQEHPFSVPVLGWKLFWGLQGVVGVDWVSLYDGDFNEKQYQSPYLGIHLLLPALKRLRLELGTEGWSANVLFNIGLYEKTETQNWRTR